MNIDQLISELQKVRNKHGNIPLILESSRSDCGNIRSYEGLEYIGQIKIKHHTVRGGWGVWEKSDDDSNDQDACLIAYK